MELGEPRQVSSRFFPSKTEELHQIQASDLMAKKSIQSILSTSFPPEICPEQGHPLKEQLGQLLCRPSLTFMHGHARGTWLE